MFGLSLKRVIAIAVFGGAIYAASQYIPPYIDFYVFNDFIRQEVKYAVSARHTTSQVKQSVFAKARELQLPIVEKDIRITRKGPTFTLEVGYFIPIDLKFYQHDLTFNHSETGESFEP